MPVSLDRSNLAKIIEDFPEQFAEGLRVADDIKIDGDVDRVVWVGVGGSSLPGDLINTYLDGEQRVELCRVYDLPRGVNENTLLFAVSYSGDTEEAVSVLMQAIERGLKIVVVTSGGRLAEIADDYNLPIVRVPSGIPPRCATGYFFSGALRVFSILGLIEEREEEVLGMIDFLKSRDYKTRAREVAKKLKNKVPMVYTSEEWGPAARVWKIKLNENSKIQSFWNVLPEMNHNEKVGFTRLLMLPVFILLRDEGTHPRILKRMEKMKEILKDKGEFIDIEMEGENTLQKMFSVLLMGDWVSYYLAMEYEIDPTPVDMVEEFKELMRG